MTFTQSDYDTLAAAVFRSDYPGYRPSVVESPNGDDQLDSGKKYAHVACKYLKGLVSEDYISLTRCLRRARVLALDVAHKLGVPVAFLPCYGYSTLRVLEYPAGVGASHIHTDFDLFTVNLWRSCPNPGLDRTASGDHHIGEIGELIGMGPAAPHHVDPLPVPQYSLVYFALPDHSVVLPSGITVGDWLQERIARSRVAL